MPHEYDPSDLELGQYQSGPVAGEYYFKRPGDFEPVDSYPADYPDERKAGNRRCQGWSKTSGNQCSNFPVRGRHYCRVHGGNAAVGSDHPRFKHGGYSQYMPERLFQKFSEQEKDENLLNLRQELALMQTRIAEVLEDFDEGGSREFWLRLKHYKDKYNEADVGERAHWRNMIFDTIELGVEEVAKWEEIGDQVERKRKLVESEHRRMKDLQAIMTMDQVNEMMALVITSVKRHVEDPRTKRKIAGEVSQIWNVGDGTLMLEEGQDV